MSGARRGRGEVSDESGIRPYKDLVTQERILVFIIRAVGSHQKLLSRESHDHIKDFQILYNCLIN